VVTRRPFLVGFVDGGAVKLRRQVFVLAVAVVDPQLDDLDLADGFFAYSLSRFFFGRDQWGISVRPGCGDVMPRPALLYRAAPGISSSPIANGAVSGSWLRLITALTP